MWDYGKEINVTLEDALLSLESLRFMLGGAIKTPTDTESVWIRHTEEVVCDAGGIVPVPRDHLTGYKYDGTEATAVTASTTHPVRLINLTTGKRTKLTTGTIDGTKAIKFVNDLMDVPSGGTQTAEGDRIRIFWEEEVQSDSTLASAVEVTISPDTFPGTLRRVA